MEPTKYKSLGNTIREAVHAIKDAPTMLPDETIEKLELGDDDILSMETYDELNELTSKEAERYANAARGYDEAIQEASHVAQLLRELVTTVNRLAKSPHGKVAKKYAKIFQKSLADVKNFKGFAGIAAKDLQKQADEYWKDEDPTFHRGTKKKKSTKRKDDIHRMMSKINRNEEAEEDIDEETN